MLRIKSILNMLLYLAAVIGFLPLAPYLGLVPKTLFPAALIFAALADRKGMTIKELPALFLALSGFLFYAVQFNRHNVVQPAAEMLVIFLAVRLIGEKNPRNRMQALTLAMFCLAASTLFDLSPGFLFYLTVLLLLFTVSMVLLTFDSKGEGFEPDRGQLRSILTVALMQPIAAAPLILFLFFILPRTQLPVWHGLTRAGQDRTGLSETVMAGDKGSINPGGAVVFRAQTGRLPSDQLYWRAIVLNSVRNDLWIRQLPPPEKSIVKGGSELYVNIFLEPGKTVFLPTLNFPERIQGYRGLPEDDRVFTSKGITGGQRNYQVLSRKDSRLATPLGINKKFYLAIPDNCPERLKRLVSGAVSGLDQKRERLKSLESLFASMNLSYALTGLPTGPDALNKFLFETKKGHCELFAVSFTTALRLAGIPARLVGGYYGGDYNEISGYYVVTEERAHIWAEAWLDGEGWVTVEPSSFAVNFEESVTKKRYPVSLKFRLMLDSLSYYWNKAIITYDFESQLSAAVSVNRGFQGFKSARFDYRKAAPYLSLPFVLAAMIILLTAKRKTAEERLLAQFKRIATARYKVDFPPSSGLCEALSHLDNPLLDEFATIYTAALYHDRQLTNEEIAALKEILDKIRKARRQD